METVFKFNLTLLTIYNLIHSFYFVIDDGSVSVWKNYTSHKAKLVTAWHALSDVTSSSRGNCMYRIFIIRDPAV